MMGADGPNPISRLAAPNPQMPSAQGFISIQSFQPADFQRPKPGPLIGQAAARSTWIGFQWAPGQGGDTPGGGGAALIGQTMPVETAWINKGQVMPNALQHKPGTVGWVGSRRGGA